MTLDVFSGLRNESDWRKIYKLAPTFVNPRDVEILRLAEKRCENIKDFECKLENNCSGC